MTARLTIAGEDVSCFTVYDVSVEVGRADIEEQPDGSVFTGTVFGFVKSGQVGDLIQLDDQHGVLFHGVITDLSADFDEDLRWQTTISAVGPLAWLGQLQAGAVDYPAETDVLRVERVLAEAGMGNRVQQTPEALNLLARAAELKPAAELAREAASDGMGVLWENPADLNTPIRYTPHALRKWAMTMPLPWVNLPPDMAWNTAGALTWGTVDTANLPGAAVPTITLDPCKVPARATFQQAIADLVRTVTVVYGSETPPPIEDPEAEPIPRPTVTRGEDPPAQEYDTQLAGLADAETYAESMLRRHQDPAWRLSSISVDLATLPTDEQAAIRNALLVGARLVVPFPLGSPVGLMWQGFIEGWKHHLVSQDGATSHAIDFNASERRLTEAAERWKDASPTTRWADTGTLTWQRALDVP